MTECFFCNNDGGEILFSTKLYRIVLVDDKDYPGYIRVVLNSHLKELTDLEVEENLELYGAVIKSERILRTIFTPDKINIASFGNLTPHSHWHIIPRYNEDKHFPNPTWAEITNPDYKPSVRLLELNNELKHRFTSLFG
jgi:diadenosine tetraphosphate (Ap4A) HIT family hydrolase